jgi:hypothetical protein
LSPGIPPVPASPELSADYLVAVHLLCQDYDPGTGRNVRAGQPS